MQRLTSFYDITNVFLVWSLVAMYNLNGKDASDEWDFVEKDEKLDKMTFQDVLEEQFHLRHEGDPDEHNVHDFDPNDKDQRELNRLWFRTKVEVPIKNLTHES